MRLKPKDIQIIRDYFTSKPVLKAYLFGSYSRNEADNDSDIGILVELDYSKNIGFGFVQMKFDLEEKLKKQLIWCLLMQSVKGSCLISNQTGS